VNPAPRDDYFQYGLEPQLLGRKRRRSNGEQRPCQHQSRGPRQRDRFGTPDGDLRPGRRCRRLL